MAVAADSAATIFPDNRVFYNKKKIFPLPPPHNIVFMIHNRLNLNSVPWETIIGMYCAEIGKETFATPDCYLKGLLAFVIKNSRSFSHQEKDMAWAYDALNFLGRMASDISHHFGNNNAMTGFSYRKNCLDYIQNAIAELSDAQTCNGFRSNESLCLLVEKTLQDFGLDYLEQSLGLFSLTPDLYAKVFELLTLMTAKDNYELGYTGLVCAGYGHQNIYPCVSHAHVGGIYFDNLKYSFLAKHDIDQTNQAEVIPIASTQTVSNLLKGVHPDYESYSLHELKNTMEAFLEDLSIPNARRKAGYKLIDKHLSEYKGKMVQHVLSEHVLPIIDNIKYLSEDGLLDMAHALIEVTGMQSACGRERGNVGGETQSGILTKSDGFQWGKTTQTPQKTRQYEAVRI